MHRIRRSTLDWQAACLLLALILAASRFSWGAVLRGDVPGALDYLLYQAATLGFNYFEFGAVRRGLGGSLVYLLGADALAATAAFHFLCAAAVATAATWLFVRLEVRGAARAASAVVMVAIMLRWGDDAGRTDMAVAALLGFATIAMGLRRPVVAVALVCTGLFIHETSFIFGAPLLAALALRSGGWPAFTPRQKGSAAMTLAASFALYAGMALLGQADVPTMVDKVRAKFIAHDHVDWAIYFALSGLRGVRTSVCQNLADPSYWVHPASGGVVMLAAYLALAWRARAEAPAALLAVLPGFVFLCVVANDISRWAMFGCFNLWLLAASAPPRTGAGSLPGWAKLAIAVALLPLVNARPGTIQFRIYAPSPVLEWAARKAGGPRTPDIEEALQRCDPDWRSVLDGAPARDGPPAR